MINNPLNNNNSVITEQIIKTNEIINLYKNNFDLDVSKYFENIQEMSLCKEKITNYRFFYPKVEGDSAFYGYFQNFDWYYMDSKWEFNIALNYLKKDSKILEIGSGNGAFLKKAATLGYDITGIELNKKTVKSLREKGFSILDKSIEDLSMSYTNQFDYVITFQVLEHIYNVGDFLTAAIKVLKPRGKLIISVPNNNSFIKHSFPSPLNLPPHHVGLWSKESLTTLAILFNLNIEKVHYEPLQDYHFDWFYETLKNKYVSKFGIFAKIFFSLFRNKRHTYLLKLVNKLIKGHTILTIYTKQED